MKNERTRILLGMGRTTSKHYTEAQIDQRTWQKYIPANKKAKNRSSGCTSTKDQINKAHKSMTFSSFVAKKIFRRSSPPISLVDTSQAVSAALRHKDAQVQSEVVNSWSDSPIEVSPGNNPPLHDEESHKAYIDVIAPESESSNSYQIAVKHFPALEMVQIVSPKQICMSLDSKMVPIQSDGQDQQMYACTLRLKNPEDCVINIIESPKARRSAKLELNEIEVATNTSDSDYLCPLNKRSQSSSLPHKGMASEGTTRNQSPLEQTNTRTLRSSIHINVTPPSHREDSMQPLDLRTSRKVHESDKIDLRNHQMPHFLPPQPADLRSSNEALHDDAIYSYVRASYSAQTLTSTRPNISRHTMNILAENHLNIHRQFNMPPANKWNHAPSTLTNFTRYGTENNHEPLSNALGKSKSNALGKSNVNCTPCRTNSLPRMTHLNELSSPWQQKEFPHMTSSYPRRGIPEAYKTRPLPPLPKEDPVIDQSKMLKSPTIKKHTMSLQRSRSMGSISPRNRQEMNFISVVIPTSQVSPSTDRKCSPTNQLPPGHHRKLLNSKSFQIWDILQMEL